MKKFALFSLIFFDVLIFTPVFAYYSPGSPTGFVNDYANLLNAQEKGALENKLFQFEKEGSSEISIVIIKSLEGDTIENFAEKLFQGWGIGKKKEDNGILVLVAKDDRQMRIEVGYGLEGALTDAQAYQIIQNVMRPAFQKNDFYGGLDKAVDSIISATKGEFSPVKKTDYSYNNQGFKYMFFGIFVLIWISGFLMSLMGFLSRSKSWWGGSIVGFFCAFFLAGILGLLWGVISAVILIPFWLLIDYLVSKKYLKFKSQGKRIPWWLGRGGSGGFGGRGFGGGGFGGFGGGSSGGGGASGRW